MRFDTWPRLVGGSTQLFKDDLQVLSSLRVLVHARRTGKPEDEVACQHVVKHAAQGPHIDTVVVRQLHQELWRLEPRRSVIALVPTLLQLLELDRMVEICDLDDPITLLAVAIVPQDVWWLDIAVDDVLLLMEVEKALGYELEDTFDLLRLQLISCFFVFG